MAELTKSQKIRISLTIIWGIITALFAGAAAQEYSSFNFLTFLGVLVFLNLPTLLYWLGFWIWGDGYIFKGFSFLLKKIGFREKGSARHVLRKIFSVIAAIFVLMIVAGIVGAFEDFFASMSDSVGAIWNIVGLVGAIVLAIKTYKKCAGIVV